MSFEEFISYDFRYIGSLLTCAARVQQSIRETLINRKDQLLRASYYEVARNEAQVANQMAIRITLNKDKK